MARVTSQLVPLEGNFLIPNGTFFVELAAFARALAVYLTARRSRLTARHVVAVGGTCLAALALAATLETFAAP